MEYSEVKVKLDGYRQKLFDTSIESPDYNEIQGKVSYYESLARTFEEGAYREAVDNIEYYQQRLFDARVNSPESIEALEKVNRYQRIIDTYERKHPTVKDVKREKVM